MKTRLLLVLFLAAACGRDSTDLSVSLRETPFRQLRGVRLGMTGRELHATRPRARYSPYLGLQEEIPGYKVSYQFLSAQSDSANADIDPADRLGGVFITQSFPTEDAAARAWAEAARTLAKERRAPDVCERFPTGGMQARWFTGEVAVAIGAFPRELNAPNVGPRVIFAVSPKEAMKQPRDGTPIACPTQ
jgi:hypothetical protein